MAPPGQVTLEVVAKVEEALKRLSSLEAKIKQLSSTGVASRITLDVSQAEASLRSVTDKLAAFLNEAKAKGSIVLKADAQQALSAVASAEKSITATLDRLKAKAATSDPLTPLANQAQKAAASINADLDKLDKSVDKTFAALKKRAAENVFAGLGENAAKEATKLNAEFKKLETAFAAALKRLNAESRKANFDPASESARKLRENVRLAAEDIAAFAGRVKTSTAAAGGDFKRLEEAERAAAQAVREFPREGVSEQFLSGIRTARELIAAFLVTLVTQRLYEFAQASVDAAVKLELLTTALTGLLGSSAIAGDKLAMLRQTADDLGVNFISLVESFRSFSPAATAAGLSLEETDAVFKSVAISSRALGFTTEETQRVLLAFRQVLQKGKFTAEELTQQIGELLPNALSILEKELGKSSEELYAMMKAGELTSDALLLLAAGQIEAFGPTATANARSAAAEIERYKNGIFDLKTAIGAGILPALVELLGALKESGVEGSEAFAAIGRAAGDLLENLTRAVKATRDVLTGDFKSLGTEIQATFYGLFSFIIKPFQNFQDAIAVGLHALGVVSDETLEKVKQSSLAFTATLEDLKSGYRGLADDYRGTGDAFADSLTEANTRVEREQRELIDKLRAGNKRLVDARAEDAEKMTKKELSELKKVEKAYESFFTKISNLSQKNKESPFIPIDGPLTTPDAKGGGKSSGLTDLQKQIEDVEKSIASLDAKREELLSSKYAGQDQREQLQAVDTAIADLKAQLEELSATEAGSALAANLAKVEEAAAKAAEATRENSAKIKEALHDLVTQNDQFRESFAKLPPAAQEAVTAIVSNFEKIAEAGKATNSDVALFGTQLLDAFTKGGVISAEFAAKLKSELGSVEGAFGSAGKALRVYSDELKAAAAGNPELASAADKATAAAQKQDVALQALLKLFELHPKFTLSAKVAQEVFGLSLDQVATKLKSAGIGSIEFNDVLKVTQGSLRDATAAVITFDEATGRYSTSTDKATIAIQAQDKELQVLLGYFKEHPGATLTAKVAQDQLGMSLDEVAAKLRAAGVETKTLDGKLSAVTAAASAAGGGFIKVGDQVLEIRNKADSAGKGLDEAGKKIGELGAKELADKPAGSVKKLADAGKGAADNLQKTATAALQAEPPLSLVAAAAEKFAGAKIDATGADAIVAIGAAAAVATPGLTGAATAVEKISAGLKGVTTEKADALTALGVAAATAGPQLATAAEPAGKFGAALQVIATALDSIDTDVAAVATGLGELTTSITTAVETGSLSTLAGAFGDLEAQAKPLAADLVGMATALEDVVKNARPAADGIDAIQGAAEKLDLKAATSGVGGLNEVTEKLANSLRDSSDNAGTLNAGLKNSTTSAGEFKTAANALGEELAGHFKKSLGVALVELGKVKTGLSDAKKASGDLRVDLAKLGTEGVQHLNNTTSAVNTLAGALQSALEIARQLRQEMSQISLG